MKAIVFDFDGTITYKSENIWNLIWKKMGFDTKKGSICDELYQKYRAGVLSYQKWCDITCELFRERGLSRENMFEESSKINIIPGFKETIYSLKEQGIKLYILSGSITDCINSVLGEDAKNFDKIIANNFVFDENGIIKKINTSPYDYQGKALYIKKLIKKLGVNPSEVCFVGNGDNDEWVYTCGCKTICINPDGADYKNKSIWNYCIEKSDDFRDLLSLLETNNVLNDEKDI